MDSTPSDEPFHSETSEAPASAGLCFTGAGREFFGIWIANLLLTLVTFGLYYPWARVRVKRFFYERTLLDDESFDYLADPKKIFRSYVIVVLFVVAVSFLETVYPIASMVAWIGVVAAAPWLIVKALRFNARNSAYRGIRFRFDGEVKESYIVFLLGPVLSALSLGLAFPYFLYRQIRYVVSGHAIGGERIDMEASVKAFYKVCAVAVGLGLLGYGALASGIVWSVLGGPSDMAVIFGVLVGAPLLLVAFSYYRASLFNLQWSATVFRRARFRSSVPVRAFLKLALKNAFLILITFGLYYPVARVRVASLLLSHMAFESAEVLASVKGLRSEMEESALGEATDALLDFDIG